MSARTPKAGKSTFTNKELEALSADDDKLLLREGDGLAGQVRVSASGSVAIYWTWRYRFGGKVKELRLGTWPKMSMPELRGVRDDAAQLLKNGKDPSAERQAEKFRAKAEQAEAIAQQHARIAAAEVLKSRITVRELFDRWESVVLINRKDGGKEIRRIFDKDVLPKIGDMAVEDIKKGHVTGVTDTQLSRGVDRLAKLTFASMRQMFRFAQDRDILEVDPTASIRKAAIGGKAVERDRVLSEDEIRELRRRIPGANLALATEYAIWLCLSTGCRIGELLKARWEHVDLDKGQWIIPEENSKNERAHKVFLSRFAIINFRALQKIHSAGPWCYTNRKGDGHVCVKTTTVQLIDRQRPGRDPLSNRVMATDALVLKGGRWTSHDLRRTAATMMVALGVLPEVAERCLNHVEENRIKRTYQRHSYEPEMREAWRLLGERLELLTREEADNVVTFKHKTAA